MNFDFINDSRFKELLARDYQELQIALEQKLSKSVLILSGSIIEASLIEYFLQAMPNGVTENQLYTDSLANLIILAEKEGLLTETEKNLASVIKDYRNLIHPGRQIRRRVKYDLETAKIANSLVTIVMNAIRSKQETIVSFSANEIIDKLKGDWNFRAIYGKVILKLKQTERNLLFDKLLDYQIQSIEKWDAFGPSGAINSDYYNLDDDIKSFIIDLKPLLQNDFLIGKLHELVLEIQKGDRVKSYALFNFIHEDVDKLNIEEQEMIAVYFLSTFSSVFENSSIINFDKTYSTVGKYITTQHGLDEFKKFTEFCIVHFSKDSIFNYEINVYEQAFNSLQESQKDEIRKFIKDFLNDHGAVPTDVAEGFVAGILRMQITTNEYLHDK